MRSGAEGRVRFSASRVVARSFDAIRTVLAPLS